MDEPAVRGRELDILNLAERHKGGEAENRNNRRQFESYPHSIPRNGAGTAAETKNPAQAHRDPGKPRP